MGLSGAGFSKTNLVCRWLESVLENSQGTAESALSIIYLNESRKRIKTSLWDNPDVDLVVKKVEEMIKKSYWFDPSLAAITENALVALNKG